MDAALDLISHKAISDAVAQRKAAGQNLPEIAREIGVSRATLCRILAGRLPGSTRTLAAVIALVRAAETPDKAA